jgi:hypothetical protein
LPVFKENEMTRTKIRKKHKWKQATFKDFDLITCKGVWDLARLFMSKGIMMNGLEGLTSPKINRPYRMIKNIKQATTVIRQRQ